MSEYQDKKLYRSRTDRVFAGVCGGLGAYFGIDPLIFRIIFLLLMFFSGTGILLYIILMIIIPKAPFLRDTSTASPEPDGRQRMHNFAEEVRENAQHFAASMRGEMRSSHNSRYAVGIVIVFFGLVLLLNQILPYRWFRWDIFWPVLVIVLGIFIITRRK